ncbi:hypothetical protein ACP4OV_003811 [Aristida adscensionis]
MAASEQAATSRSDRSEQAPAYPNACAAPRRAAPSEP